MKETDYSDPTQMHTSRYLQATLLEALRCDRDKWNTRMSEVLFDGTHRNIYWAIMNAEDPTDPAQVVAATTQPIAVELATMIAGDVVVPVNDEGVMFRLGKLQGIRRKKKLHDALTGARQLLDSGEDPTSVLNSIEDEYHDETSILGPFAKAKSLDEPVETEDDEMPPALVRKVLYPNGLSVLSGPGGLGKSWLAIFMGLCVAQGEFWLGLQCETRKVGYISLEMHSAGVRDRIRKLTEGKMDKAARERFFYIGQENVGRAVDIMDEMFKMSLASWVAERNLDLVIVDPLRNAHKQDENSSTEMGNVLRCFSELGCAVLLIHHVSKEGSSRGSTAIRDWSDTMITLSERKEILYLGWEKRPRFDAVKGDIPIEIGRTAEGIVIQRTDG